MSGKTLLGSLTAAVVRQARRLFVYRPVAILLFRSRPTATLPYQAPWPASFHTVPAIHMQEAARGPIDRSHTLPYRRGWL